MQEISIPPVRVLVIVRPGSSVWSTAWTLPDSVVSASISQLKRSHLLPAFHDEIPRTLLAQQRYHRFIHIVFDIFHQSYDAALGHLPKSNILPVLVVTFERTDHAQQAQSKLSKLVNTEIAKAHNLNGIDSMPPFIEDHTSGLPPLYLAPREPSWLEADHENITSSK